MVDVETVVEGRAPRRSGARRGGWRRVLPAVLWGLVAVAIVRVPAYLWLRHEHLLFRTGWVRHRSYRDAETAAWGWRDVRVAGHPTFAASRPLLARGLEIGFLPEREAEVWFREHFESCCSFDPEERCDHRPPSWWKWPPHDSGDD